MRRDWLRSFDKIRVNTASSELDILGSLWSLVRAAQEVMREAELEVVASLDLIDLFRRQLDGQRLDVRFEMFDLATTDNRGDVWRCVLISGGRNSTPLTVAYLCA